VVFDVIPLFILIEPAFPIKASPVRSVTDPDAEVFADPEETSTFPDDASALIPSAERRDTAPLEDELAEEPVRISTLPPVLAADDPAAIFT
jgi:hypothetical protein